MHAVEKTFSLDALGTGHSGRLVAMALLPAEQQRMAELGLTAGTPVVVAKRSHWGGPLELRVRGCKLSLRREVAQRIQVTVEQQHGH